MKFRRIEILPFLLAASWLAATEAPAARRTAPDRIQTITPAPPAASDAESASSPSLSPILHQVIDGRPALSWIRTGTNLGPGTASLFLLTNPPVTRPRYALTGEVSYAGVQGEGYLEMWSQFGPAKPGLPTQRAFTRTLAASGRLGRISGDSDWRAFELPMDGTGATGTLTRLEVNLVLPGPGTVHVGPLTLVEYPGAWPWSASNDPDAWWSPRVGGWVGGFGGAFLGILGGTFGWLAGRGKARGLVTAGMRGLIAVGSMCLVAGGAAYVQSQPYAVWYPLVLTGVLSIAILPFGLRQMVRQYETRELQKIQAADKLSH
ncbi:MAG: hypothetical protein AB7O66_01545 [Limisphaerales bacterium]